MAQRSLPEMPCGPILELHGQRKRFHIPYGLRPLLEDLTREVLRVQPENVYTFLALLMENRLRKKREEEEQRKARKSWKQHRWSWEGKSVLPQEELAEFLDELHVPVEEVNQKALVIQSAYRGYMARKKVKEIRRSKELNAAPLKVEEGGQEKRKSWQVHRWSFEGKSVLEPDNLNEFIQELEKEHHLNKDIIEEKAVKIQSAFRGYQARKKVKEIRKSKEGADLGVPPPAPVEVSQSPDSSGGTGPAESEGPNQEDAGSSDPSPPPPEEEAASAAAQETTEAPVESHAEETEPAPSGSEAETAAPPE